MKNSPAYHLLKKAMKRNWYYIVALLFLSIIVACISSVSPLFYQKIIDEAIVQKDLHHLIIYVFILVLLPVLNTLLSTVRNKAGYFFSDKCAQVMRRAAFEKALTMQYPNFENIGAQKCMHAITRSVGRITEVYLYSDFVNFVTNTVQLVVVFIIIQSFSIKIALLTFISIPLLYGMMRLFSNKTGKDEKKLLDHLNKCEKFLLECFYGMKTVRSYNAQAAECDNFEKWLRENEKLGWKVKSSHNLVRAIVPQAISQIILGVLFVVCAVFVMEDDMSLGTLVAIIAYVPTMISAINGLLSIKVGKSAIAKILPDLDLILASESECNAAQTDPISVNENIVNFNNVDFSYGRGEFRLKINDLNIKKGDFIAIVGTSGGGKTSVLDILNKFYPTESGEIMFFGERLENVNPNALRSRISSVFQDVYVFNKTIAQNISYPQEPDMQKIGSVIEKAALGEFIESLPERENSVINDFGSNFSGGECQRIALARALYKDSDILLLDEPTAALDAVTAEKIFETLISENKEKNKTVIMITHDIGKALFASKAVVIENGKVAESGSPAELLDQNGKFKRLYDAQQNS